MIPDKNTATLSREDFNKLSAYIYEISGIKMPEAKKIMMEARLRKRLRELNINSYKEYCKFLFSETGKASEVIHMVDVLTTNKTDFFREPDQFTFLTQKAIPNLILSHKAGIRRPLKVWSAGCSTGEEPYTLSIVLSEFGLNVPQFDFSIFATDISTKVLEAAKRGIFAEEKVKPINILQLKKYFLRCKDHSVKIVKIIPELQEKILFKWLNFMDEDFKIQEKFDVIFCRNVIIYFDKKTQETLINKLLRYLVSDGYLFLGHSESIFTMDLPLVQVSASTYRKIR